MSDPPAPTPAALTNHPGNADPVASARLSRARRSDTAPELALRRTLHALGLRYRVGLPVPGAPRRSIDIAFTRVKVAVFVDGCYWHGCPEHATSPKNNADWWRAKFAANVERDADTNRLLEAQGWQVLRVWEHTDSTEAADLAMRLVSQRRHSDANTPAHESTTTSS